MDYKVVLMKDAEEDLDRFITYLLLEKKSEQAARNLLNDFEATKISLSNVAGSLKLCDNLKLRELGYRRINFLSHRYFMLYRIENDTVYVDNIFHELQDYENKMNYMFEYKILPMGSSLNFEHELGDSLDRWDFSMRKVICKSDICCREHQICDTS